MSFPNLTAPKSGQLYTLVITNNFALYAAGKAAPNSSTMCKFENDPLILTFTGSQTASNKAQIQAISIEDNSTLDFLSEITYKFNAPILANSEYQVLVKENSDLFAVSKSAIVENETDLVVKFGENVNLNLGHTYSITLPEGIVELIEDKSVKNNEFTFNVNGAKTYTFALLSVQPSNGEMCLPSTASISYDIPEGYNITGGPNQAINKSLKIYKEEVAEQNLIATYLNGEFNSSKNGLEWDLSRISYEPSTKYVLYREAGLNNLFNESNKKLPEWTNQETQSYFVTPSITESGIAPLEFQSPVIGTYNYKGNNTFLNDGDKIASLSKIEYVVRDLKYSYNGELYGSGFVGMGASVLLYDITSGTPTLIKEITLNKSERETTTMYYSAYVATINSEFFEGHKYRLVLPAGVITAGPNAIRNYVANEETVVEFEGSTPSSVDMISCSIQNDAELSQLAGIVWTFKGDFVKDPSLSVRIATSAGGYEIPTFVSSSNGQTTVKAFDCAADGSPRTLRAGTIYTAIFPEGLLYYAGDEAIKNTEYRVSFTGVAKTPEVIEPEFVNVKITTNDFLITDQQAVKGKPFTYTMDFEDETPWAVESVNQNGKSLSVVDGTFTTSALTGNTDIDIEIAYKGQWAVDEKGTGVYEIRGTDISIFKDVDFIVVTGVTPENTINVYNLAGMLINTTHVNGDNDTVRITVAPGQYYIVTVDGVAAKIRM